MSTNSFESKSHTNHFYPFCLKQIQLSRQEQPFYTGLFSICTGSTPLSDGAYESFDGRPVGVLTLRAYLAGKEIVSMKQLDKVSIQWTYDLHCESASWKMKFS